MKLIELVYWLDQHRLVGCRSVFQFNSSALFNAVPSISTGTQLDSVCLRISVSLRIGPRICESHKCCCEPTEDSFGLHPLLCHYSAGRLPCHVALNENIKLGLGAADSLLSSNQQGWTEEMVKGQTTWQLFCSSVVELSSRMSHAAPLPPATYWVRLPAQT